MLFHMSSTLIVTSSSSLTRLTNTSIPRNQTSSSTSLSVQSMHVIIWNLPQDLDWLFIHSFIHVSISCSPFPPPIQRESTSPHSTSLSPSSFHTHAMQVCCRCKPLAPDSQEKIVLEVKDSTVVVGDQTFEVTKAYDEKVSSSCTYYFRNKQTNKQRDRQTNKQTDKQTSKQRNLSILSSRKESTVDVKNSDHPQIRPHSHIQPNHSFNLSFIDATHLHTYTHTHTLVHAISHPITHPTIHLLTPLLTPLSTHSYVYIYTHIHVPGQNW